MIDQGLHLLRICRVGFVAFFVLRSGIGADVALLLVRGLQCKVYGLLKLDIALFLVSATAVECSCQSPMTDCAVRIETHSLLKCTQSFVVPEAMQRRQTLLK